MSTMQFDIWRTEKIAEQQIEIAVQAIYSKWERKTKNIVSIIMDYIKIECNRVDDSDSWVSGLIFEKQQQQHQQKHQLIHIVHIL